MVKLKKQNLKKYCINCKESVIIRMEGLDGYCPYCDELLYTINNKKKDANE